MKADFKKRLISIQRELKELIDDHSIWMEEHDDDWESSPSGEKAVSESYEMDTALDYIQGITQVEIED